MLLPFVLKALSMALGEYEKLDSVLGQGLSSDQKSRWISKGLHNFGLTVETPNGLLVPVVRNVQEQSVSSLTADISRLGTLVREGKLTPTDMKDSKLVVSNIGNIGGSVVAPVILSPLTAIMAVGRMEDVPVFVMDDGGNEGVIERKHVVLSWSADHRVLDGANVARCAQQVALWMENPSWLNLDVN
jgi:2-oxoisovalerate dehydrogenase E2 component (dihydrolipoyl transacylase)